VSKLLVRTSYAGEFALNVLAFQSSLFGTMMGAQTKNYMVYFPVKCQQPDVEFSVQFASIADYEGFQNFARVTQKAALINSLEPTVALFWPQRNILNWTGTIRNFEGGLDRFTYAPAANFTVDLVDSLVSMRTQITSVAPLFDTVYGWNTPQGELALPGGVSPTQLGNALGGIGNINPIGGLPTPVPLP
jgi:hypothetical protein